MASGRSIVAGPGGIASGSLILERFVQLGATPQTLTLGSSAMLYLGVGNVFNAPLTTTSGALYVTGGTFNGACSFTKTGASGDGSAGGNVFNGPVELTNTNTGNLSINYNGADVFNDDVRVNNTSTGQINFGQVAGSSTIAAGHTFSVGALGYSSGSLVLRHMTQVGATPQVLALGTAAMLNLAQGNVFDGNVTATSGSIFLNGTTYNGSAFFTKTGAGGDASIGGNVFNGALELVNTNTGNMSICQTGVDVYNGDVRVNSTSTGHINFGAATGLSTLAAGRTISVGSLGFATGRLGIRGMTQVGPTAQSLTLGTAADLIFGAGSTFDGDVTSVSGALYLNGTTFNGQSYFTKTGPSGDASAGGNVFNGRAEFVNTNSGNLSLDFSGADTFNADIVVNNTSNGTIRFGQSTGTATLAAGHTISVGPLGFASGSLIFRGFTQLGTTPQNLVLGIGATLSFGPSNTFNGDITTTSGALFFGGTTFNGNGVFTKTGASGDASAGGNVFNGRAEFIKTGTGNLSLDYNGVDLFNGDIVLNSTAAGQIYFGQSTGSATLAAGRTISVGSLGFAAGQLVLRNFAQLGATPQGLVLGSGAQLTYASGTTFNGDVTSTSGTLYLNGATFNGRGFFTKTGPSGDGSSGGNVFNGRVELTNTSTGNLSLDYNGVDQFNGDLVVNSTSTGMIYFGQSTGSATLAAGGTVSVGTTGFNSGSLLFRNFTQVGSTPQVLSLGSGAQLVFVGGNTFNGPLTTTSGALAITGSTFNGVCDFTKTGSTTENSSGANTFNADVDITVSGTGALNLDCYTGLDQFNGDLRLNNLSTGQIGFGLSTGSAALAAGRTVSIGAGGFAAGTLYFRNFTQLGGTPQTLTLGTSALLRYEANTVFNGALVSTSGGLFFAGARFNGNARFTKTGTTTENATAGNVFNGNAEFILAGTGSLGLACYSPTDQFNGDILVNNTSTGQLSFGLATGSATLGAGRTIAVGSLGFATGTLLLRNFRQVGATAQNLALTGTASMIFSTGNVFDGDLTTVAPTLLLNGSTFNGTSSFTKTGAGTNNCYGNNVFNGDVEINATGPMALSVNAPDDYNGNATFRRQSASTFFACYNYNSAFSKNVSTVGSTGGSVSFGNGASQRVIFDGSGLQTFSSDVAAPPLVRNLTLNKSGGTLDLLNDVIVTGDIVFTSGVIRPQAATSTSTGLLILNSGITISDVADVGSYVDGFVRKVGNTAFSFPVGNAGVLAPIRMSAPGNIAHHFTAKYTHDDPTATYNTALHDPTLHHLSHCEYWILDRTNGASNVSVTLSFDSVNSCGVTSLSDLRVARWNGTTWKDHGNGGTTGTTASGTVVSAGAVTSFSPFTLASFNAMNPLPIELLSFTAVGDGPVVRTAWATATERNNERFEVERSADGETFTVLGTLAGAGDSQSELHYSWVDEAPLSGLSYYRLKQVDFDGAFTYSDIVPVYRGGLAQEGVRVFPNPAVDQVTVALQRAVDGPVQVTLINAQGQVVSGTSRTLAAGEAAVQLPLEGLSAGLYHVRLEGLGGSPVDLRLLKQ